jgi:hypothetical protein
MIRSGRSALAEAAAKADEKTVRALLESGAPVDGEASDRDSPLFCVCASDAPDAQRLAVARLLIGAGAFTRIGCTGGATPLHAAARPGPAELVELLLTHGAVFWQPDDAGRQPIDEARDGTAADKQRIIHLCCPGPVIENRLFRSAVAAIHAGDISALGRLLTDHPELLHEPAMERDRPAKGYFSDPKLFWFVANNPTLMREPPDNLVDIAKLMMARGVSQADLDYALELAMSSASLGTLQIPLVQALVDGGATVTRSALLMGLGHEQTSPVGWLLDHGLAPSAPSLAALGRTAELKRSLGEATEQDKNDALDVAVINRQRDAVNLCLDAGADPNHFMAVHSHATPAHQAAWNDDPDMLAALIAHGACLDVEDTMWRGTPLGWALHGGRSRAAAFLQKQQ